MLSILSDSELLTAISKADQDALIELHHRYAPYLAALTHRMLADKLEAQQCVEDCFVKVWQNADTFDVRRESPLTWLVTLCHRLAINRAKNKHLMLFPLHKLKVLAKEAKAKDAYLEDAFEHLSLREQELFNLAYLQGHSYSQMVLMSGQPLEVVKGTVSAALLHLQERLKEKEVHGAS